MPTDADAAVLTVVGSGTLVPDAERGSAAHGLRTESASILLDCGTGTLHSLDALGVGWQGLTHVAITHFHYDHLGDLPALLLALKYGVEEPRTEPLTLVGPPGFAGHLRRLSDAHGIAFLDQAFELRIAEMAPGSELVDAAFGLTWRCAKTVHTEESVAYALHGGWGSVAYTGDTGPSDELAGFLAGHDVLVAECSHPDPPPTGLHLTPSTLAGLATVARPELLVVTHVYPSLGPREAVSRLAERYGGRVVAGADGLRVRIRRGDVAVDLPTGPV